MVDFWYNSGIMNQKTVKHNTNNQQARKEITLLDQEVKKTAKEKRLFVAKVIKRIFKDFRPALDRLAYE